MNIKINYEIWKHDYQEGEVMNFIFVTNQYRYKKNQNNTESLKIKMISTKNDLSDLYWDVGDVFLTRLYQWMKGLLCFPVSRQYRTWQRWESFTEVCDLVDIVLWISIHTYCQVFLLEHCKSHLRLSVPNNCFTFMKIRSKEGIVI